MGGNRGFYGFSTPRSASSAPIHNYAYPTQAGALLLWLRADTIGANDGDALAAWPDNTGLATIVQTNASLRPTYKTNAANGLPAVRFDYGNYMMVTNFVIGATVTFMCVYLNGTQNGSGSIHKPILASVDDPYKAGSSGWSFAPQRSGSDGFNMSQGSASSVGYSFAATQRFEIVTAVKSGGIANLYRSGLLQSTNAFTGTGGNINGYTLGAQLSDSGRRYIGDIAELLVWSTALSDDERGYTEKALMAKYGIF